MELKLNSHYTITEKTCREADLTSHFSDDDLSAIGRHVYAGYVADKSSRAEWELRMAAAMNLAMQVVEPKSFPWPNASNVAFPLVTIAAMQFHARAYPALINGTDIVKFRTFDDEAGKVTEIARACGDYMSYQLLEEDVDWEEQQDRLLLTLPIMGCVFKKSYYSPQEQYNESEMVSAKDLVLDYFASSVEKCQRKTHVYPLYRNDIREGVKADEPYYRDVLDADWYKAGPSSIIQGEPRRDGTTPPQPSSSSPYTILEQHCWLDLDGDGYAEPYVVLAELNSKQVIRIVARWERPEDVVYSKKEIIKILPFEFFTLYTFIPAPDGSIYGLGFGVLLGPLNESVSSLVNQLIDAGTMSIAAGGFLGRGAKIRGGSYSFAPFEWKRVDSTGDDLQKSIYPLPVREPSNVLFQLLGLLIDYTNRISASTETMMGENPGQNTPKANMDTMVEQGMKIYGAIFKRVWRSMKQEFRKLYALNALYAPPRYAALFQGDSRRICPVADPTVISDATRLQQAITIAGRASTVPGYEPFAVEENLLRALRVDNWKRYYKGVDPNKPPPEDPKVTVEKMKDARERLKLQLDAQTFALELIEQQKLNRAQIVLLEAQATKEMADAQNEGEGVRIATIQAMVTALKAQDDKIGKRIDQFLKLAEIESDPEARKSAATDDVRRLAETSGNGADATLAGIAATGGQGGVVAG